MSEPTFWQIRLFSDPKVGNDRCQQTNGAVFRWEKPCRKAGNVTYQDCDSTFNNSMKDAIRKGTAENEVQKHEKIDLKVLGDK